jgi:CheY-like chemotaxis protein
MTANSPAPAEAVSAQCTNCSDYCQLQAAHERSREELGQLQGSRCKTYELIDALAQECRTPLTVLREYCSLVHDELAGRLTDLQRGYLKIAIGRATDLTRLLNDFADMAGLESGKCRFQPKAARLQEIIDRIEPTLQSQSAAANVRLRLAIPHDLAKIYCDSRSIGRAIVDVVCHGLRTVEDGGELAISAELRAESRQVVVRVASAAAGDERADGTTVEPSALATFSLAAARALVQANFSELQIERRAGGGAAWSFALPLAEPEAVAGRETRKRRILLVDDDRAIVEALRIRLSLFGYEVHSAHDGSQGLSAAALHRPDVILLDVRMPVMDGLTMLARLRENPATRNIPVVMVSASHDDRKRALELGAYFFVEKPYDPNVLKLTIASILRSSESREFDVKADSGIHEVSVAEAAAVVPAAGDTATTVA